MNYRMDQKGDTIVEVLIAIAVVGLVLAGAFRSAGQSSAAVQRSSERVEALKITESQVEALRSNATSAAPSVFSGASVFCMDPATRLVNAHPADCSFGTDSRYLVTITQDNPNPGTFSISSEWDAFGTGEPENITMYYRIAN